MLVLLDEFKARESFLQISDKAHYFSCFSLPTVTSCFATQLLCMLCLNSVSCLLSTNANEKHRAMQTHINYVVCIKVLSKMRLWCT